LPPLGREAALSILPATPYSQVLRLLRSRTGASPLATESSVTPLANPSPSLARRT
jgi:hypothetical protein